jgi:hypothetical protein
MQYVADIQVEMGSCCQRRIMCVVDNVGRQSDLQLQFFIRRIRLYDAINSLCITEQKSVSLAYFITNYMFTESRPSLSAPLLCNNTQVLGVLQHQQTGSVKELMFVSAKACV